jgi:hypothetical protein
MTISNKNFASAYMGFFFYLLFLPIRAQAAEVRLAGCEFIFDMPANYRVERVHSKYFSHDQARSSVKNVFLQAECLPYVASEGELQNMVLVHAESTGGYGGSFKKTGNLKYEYRYYKNINGVGASTFLVHMYVGRKSTLIAIGGVQSNHFPSDVISKFHSSIR